MDQDGWMCSSEFGRLVAQLTGKEESLSCDELQILFANLDCPIEFNSRMGCFELAMDTTVPLYHGTSAEN